MSSKYSHKFFAVLALSVMSAGILAQDNVPLGIHYQAVARDNYGNELVNRKISVRFSIISEDPLGTVVYQELHQDILTSRFGVFSLIIGHGTPTGNAPCGELSQIKWESAYHYLKVEVKFENEFMDMGTMQFLAVPYALYARKSLEPGPAGPRGEQGLKGEPGDPASDDQALSFDGSTLSIGGGNSLSLTDLLQNLTVSYQLDGTYLGISRGNSVKLATIEADGDPKNEIQDLTISSDKLKITNNALATEWDLSPYRQSLSWDSSTRVLSISGTDTPINLSELKDDADADITNEIQDLSLTGDLLTITKNTSSAGIDLGKYLDDTDKQQMAFNTSDNILSLTNSTSVDLTSLKNDADFDVTNEIQDIKLTGDLLTITKNDGSTGVSLNKYLDDTDKQQLGFSTSTNILTLTNSVSVDLSSLKNDADYDPANEIQSLNYTESDLTKSLSISGSNSVVLDNKVAFRAKNTSSDVAAINSYPVLTYDEPEYDVGNNLDETTGIFTAPVNGIYIFNVAYFADGSGDGREIAIYVNSALYEKLALSIGAGSTVPVKSVTVKLNATNTVSVVIYTGLASQTGTGSFSGYKVN
jgi:hypothetical protein